MRERERDLCKLSSPSKICCLIFLGLGVRYAGQTWVANLATEDQLLVYVAMKRDKERRGWGRTGEERCGLQSGVRSVKE